MTTTQTPQWETLREEFIKLSIESAQHHERPIDLKEYSRIADYFIAKLKEDRAALQKEMFFVPDPKKSFKKRARDLGLKPNKLSYEEYFKVELEHQISLRIELFRAGLIEKVKKQKSLDWVIKGAAERGSDYASPNDYKVIAHNAALDAVLAILKS